MIKKIPFSAKEKTQIVEAMDFLLTMLETQRQGSRHPEVETQYINNANKVLKFITLQPTTTLNLNDAEASYIWTANKYYLNVESIKKKLTAAFGKEMM